MLPSASPFTLTCIALVAGCASNANAQPAVSELLSRASAAAAAGDSGTAIRWASDAIEREPSFAPAYRLRGREQFRIGKVKAAVRDFDRFVELRPGDESRQWERGIAYYYAKQYQQGADQFALYQTYHSSDVENSVWRFLCMVPTEGIEKARAQMLPIRDDRRIPMMQIYDMYRGTLQPGDVLEAAQLGQPAGDRAAGRLFYAHLYIGLYYEATGEQKKAARYIRLAADEELAKNGEINRYMWDVARIHAARLAN